MDIKQLNWNKLKGLIPAIVQDGSTGRVLMLGFMNGEALERTLETQRVTFWSRSRKCLWTKGETSGNYLELEQIRQDCDNDTLLVVVKPQGPCCHRGTLSCFAGDDEFSGLEFLGYLERLIARRKEEMPEGSYTSTLFAKGLQEIAKKVGEEAIEVVLSSGQEKQRTVEESADLLYHLLVFLTQREVTLQEVVEELRNRSRPEAG